MSKGNEAWTGFFFMIFFLGFLVLAIYAFDGLFKHELRLDHLRDYACEQDARALPDCQVSDADKIEAEIKRLQRDLEAKRK